MLADHGVLQRAVLERNARHLAARLVHRLLHRHRHFARLTLAHADAAIAVAHHGQRGEAENAPPLDDLGHTVDGNHLFAQGIIALFGCLRLSVLLLGHR